MRVRGTATQQSSNKFLIVTINTTHPVPNCLALNGLPFENLIIYLRSSSISGRKFPSFGTSRMVDVTGPSPSLKGE